MEMSERTCRRILGDYVADCVYVAPLNSCSRHSGIYRKLPGAPAACPFFDFLDGPEDRRERQLASVGIFVAQKWRKDNYRSLDSGLAQFPPFSDGSNSKRERVN